MARSRKPSEYKLQKIILAYLRNLPGCWSVKIITANERGVPDIVCCYKGKFFAFELKSQKGHLTKLQQYQIQTINDCGGVAGTVRDKKDVENFLGELK